MPDVSDKLDKALKECAPDGRISCQEAWQLARDNGVEFSEVGAACNELGIKIHSCQLGCF